MRGFILLDASLWGARGGKSMVWIGSLSFNFTDPKTI